MSGTEDEVTIGEKGNETLVMPSGYSQKQSKFNPTTQKSVSHVTQPTKSARVPKAIREAGEELSKISTI